MDADSLPGRELFADMAKEIRSGNCVAGGSTIRWDQENFMTELMMPLLNAGFRWRRLLHGCFIFIEATRSVHEGFAQETFCREDWELSRRLQKLAKDTGKRFVILHRHPVVSSARRWKNYSALVPFKVLYHVIFVPRRIRISRETGHRWYDGRTR